MALPKAEKDLDEDCYWIASIIKTAGLVNIVIYYIYVLLTYGQLLLYVIPFVIYSRLTTDSLFYRIVYVTVYCGTRPS